ncbi:MAG: bifunctional nuclease family protein [Chloroflexi bacterium]|nr:bifunctional nuclease family protein [Chloroflexota bacterium]
MIEVKIDSIRVSLVSPQRVVLLKEVHGERLLPIWIGPVEAEAIQYALHDVEVARPLTHDLLKNVFRALGARVLRVEVVKLQDNIFYGNIVAEIGGRIVNIDARPSDALALAVRAHVPIYVAREVMDAAGIVPEPDMSDSLRQAKAKDEEAAQAKPTAQAEVSLEDAEVSEDRLSIFEDFLEKLEGGETDEEPPQQDE